MSLLASRKKTPTAAQQAICFTNRIDSSAQGFTYSAKPSQCRNCSHKPACTPSSTRRTLRVNWYEDVREQVRKLCQTPEFAIARRARNKIEALFSELRNQIRLRKIRLRGLRNAKEQFTLAATAQNVKPLDKVSEPTETFGCSDDLKRSSSSNASKTKSESEPPRAIRHVEFFNSIARIR